MPKQLILCEKPSVAQDFVRALGDFQKHDGYYESEKYVVTWAYGHLCELKEPQDYNPELKKWSLDTLPIFPQKFEYKVTKDGAKQFNVIKKLVQRQDISSCVIATDCGREGELIARLIFMLAGNKKPVYRFWTSEALTPQVVRKTMNSLKPASEFDRLYQSALARQWADWLVGINCTRAVSVKNNELFSVGRVQTAVLSLIVQREKEIQNFKPVPFYNVVATFVRGKDEFKGIYVKQVQDNEDEKTQEDNADEGLNSQYAVTEKSVADAITNAVKNKTGIIQKVVSKISSEKPPLLFSLTTLQQECNKFFGFSADKTLNIAQSLYEKKLISYPRTESQYLDPQYAEHCVRILSQIKGVVEFDLNKCRVDKNNKRVFDLSKLTDHHALIPQGKPSGALSEDEQKVYELVCKRFISAFYPDCKFKNTSIYIKIGQYNFVSKGKVLLDPGWRAVYGGLKSDTVLPEVRENEKVHIKDAETVEKQTQPPPRYTDASLLEIMANAHKVVTDERLKKILKENAGIGTPATRAGILKTLLDRKYLVKKGKVFIPTEKAFFLAEILKGEEVASAEYTAVWEQELEKIAKGEAKDVKLFLGYIVNYIRRFIEKIKQNSMHYDKKVVTNRYNTKKGSKKYTKKKKEVKKV